MPNPTRGIAVRLFPEDRERFLRFSLKTLEAIQLEFGEDALSGNVTGTRLAKILWYGLKADARKAGEVISDVAVDGNDTAFTPDWIGEEVDMENLPATLQALSKAFGADKKEAALPSTPSA